MSNDLVKGDNPLVAEAKSLLNSLYPSKGGAVEIKGATTAALRVSLIEFLQERMRVPGKIAAILDIIDATFVKDILAGNCTHEELMKYRDLLAADAQATSAIALGPFKPSNSTGNPLLQPPKEEGDANELSAIDSLSYEQRTAFNKLTQILNAAAEREAAKKVNQDVEYTVEKDTDSTETSKGEGK